MRFGIVGLGRIGGNLALQALEKDHQVVGYNRSPQATRSLAKNGLDAAFSPDELVRKLGPPRILWLYVPHGRPTDQVIADLNGRLTEGDVVYRDPDSVAGRAVASRCWWGTRRGSGRWRCSYS
jgi:6-phosphogluconate dehydrogenase